MEVFSVSWVLSLLAILLIDLVLAGEHALAIAAAARCLPRHLLPLAFVAGIAVAVLMRTLMTLGVLWLLQIPGLMLLGGLGLSWIAYRTLIGRCATDAAPTRPAHTFWTVLCSIVLADALTGIDNVLAVAAASRGSGELVVIGLLVSIPMIVFGSSRIPQWLTHLPQLRTLAAAIMAFTAAQMIVEEPWQLQEFFSTSPLWYWGFVSGLALVVLGAGWRKRQQPASA